MIIERAWQLWEKLVDLENFHINLSACLPARRAQAGNAQAGLKNIELSKIIRYFLSE
jgi:hypothetical protein